MAKVPCKGALQNIVQQEHRLPLTIVEAIGLGGVWLHSLMAKPTITAQATVVANREDSGRTCSIRNTWCCY